ncbi:MAG: hypothetical protein IPO95_04450 [Rhodanobacteraceae bacterium]|jgi:hypothetical protein|nr:hypothetical protein [Rhodanobacteraceae bacterium]MBL0039943.1 hypothetical protein [Xanthomonadales bacterium]MBP6078586.1 hypothetical protein [Xanthomonadales bacterium]MBP7623155.1 hypothetical protein [Xanthomonadales bacterium]
MRRVTLTLLLALLSVGVGAQAVDDSRTRIPFQQTDAWAMAYVAASTLFTGHGASPELDPGAYALSAELGHVPRLDEDALYVGLGGSKREDLNKSPVVGRARLWLGLPYRFVFELGWVPPLEIDGAHAQGLVSAALGRRWLQRGRWTLSARLHGQAGAAVGDVTCPAAIAGSADPARNPFGCLRPSRDRIELGQYGLEGTAAFDWGARGQGHASLGWLRMEPEVRIHADLRDYDNRSALVSRGLRPYAALGFSHDHGARWQSAVELLYLPLRIRRPGHDPEASPYWSLRLMLRRRMGAD